MMSFNIRRKLVHRLFGGDMSEVDIAFSVIGGHVGTMFDVGAHWGTTLDPFLRSGWTVYAFEPDPSNRAVLASRYPGAAIDPRAVSETDGQKLSLYTSDISTGISTLSPFHSTHTPTAEVETVRLDTFVRDNNVGSVDFLKTDVEGFDLFALRTFPWESHHPKAVVCEFEDNKTIRLGYSADELAEFLEGKGYAVIVSEWHPVIEYGGRHRWRRFTRYLPEKIPSDSFGNLIAVEPCYLDIFLRACEVAGTRIRARRRVERLLALSV
jgi:FkbM family methyltransferase